MCNVDTDGVIEMIQAAQTLDLNEGDVMCRKCGEAVAEVVLRVKDAYCRDCFLAYFIHKFRSTIGKSKQIHPGDRILVCVSGGDSSTALLHLIKQGLQENSHKKLRFEPVFLHVDECVLHRPSDEGCEDVNRVVKEVVSLGFPCYVTSLEQVMAPEPYQPKEWKDIRHTVDANLRTKCSDLFASCTSASAQQDLHDQLLHTVLRQSAHSLGFSKMFLGDNSTTMSVRILSQVALGRGSQLPKRVHFRSVCEGIEVYRPMRELLENEITHYLNLQNITVPKPPVFKPKSSSITSCTEDFIRSLQKDFPATTPTIFRTGDKLVSSNVEADKRRDSSTDNHRTEDCCVICASNLDTDKGEASALHATVVSQKYSNKKPQEISQNSGRVKPDVSIQENKLNQDKERVSAPGGGPCGCDRSGGGCGRDNRNVEIETTKAMEQYLCYGCRVTLRDVGDIQLMPASMWKAMAQHKKRRDMREQIQDFLL